MAKLVYDAVAVIGKKKDGAPVRMKIGTVWETDKGLSMKLDAVPVGTEFNGWISFYEPKPKEERSATTAQRRPSAAPSLSSPAPFVDDDVPF